jgi:hypothetical protein
MLRFSERMGFREVKNVIQIDSIDEELLNGLWNAVMEFYYSKYFETHNGSNVNHYTLNELSKRIWIDFFKEPIDELNLDSKEPIDVIRNFLYSNQTEWFEIYDLIEFIPNNFKEDQSINSLFMDHCNGVLEKEVSAYRFVKGSIVQITTTEEIQEIELAITSPSTSDLVKVHLSNALKHLADRQSPDYRTSIKESISAVECVAKRIVGNTSTTLGNALNEIQSNGIIDFHQDLNLGLKKIYHYTSDSDGIRHALKDAPTVDFEDAKFMLVMCSSFCNYLTIKADKAGISLI